MTVFDGTRVQIGPGTLYAAPLGTTEPTSVTGAWPAGWVELGYTETGSQFQYQLQTADVTVEEEILAIDVVPTGAKADLSFSLAELTRQNLLLVLNAGITTLAANTSGAGSDSSLWAEPPAPGTEKHIMLGWDAAPEGATSTANVLSGGRLIARECVNTGNLQIQRRKGNSKALYAATFSLIKPTGAQPFRFWFPPQMAS